jgi:hypothetical protein
MIKLKIRKKFNLFNILNKDGIKYKNFKIE